MSQESLVRSLLKTSDWVAAICNCRDSIAKRLALYTCAKVVLPCWESRFESDESMEKLVHQMLIATSPSPEHDAQLKAAIPERLRRYWDLSPPPGFPEEIYSDCPADFAGDSIFYAANAMLNDPVDDGDDWGSFDNALECFARLFVEREAQYDDNTDYRKLASEHLRKTMLQVLDEFAA